ncbi:MAG: hypothetical protein MH137_00525 [Flavobacteriales bacterium]|nr:hypothetical protein [Flavobacteriales bacterium]
MKFKLFIIGTLLLYSNLLFSQDKIVFRDGSQTDGKVIEITSSEIKYLKSKLSNGPLYSIDIREINSIIYEDGTIELISKNNSKRGKTSREIIPQKNRIAVSYFLPYVGSTDDIRTFTTVGIWYERRLTPFFALKIPFEMNVASYNQSFMIGFMPKYYFNRSKIIQGFAGPEILLGVGKDKYYDFTNSYYNYPTNIYTQNRPSFINTAAANVGMSINPIECFNMTMDMGIGVNIFNYFKTTGYQDQSMAKFMFKLGISMGYNF